MDFGIDKAVFEKFPNYCVGLVYATNIQNRESGMTEKDLLERAEEYARLSVQGVQVKEHPSIALWRDAFSLVGINPNKHRCSIEALLLRITKGDSLPNVNALVDIVNSISLKYLVPAGSHDIRLDYGDIQVRFSAENEEFAPIGSETKENVPAGELVYGDAHGIRTRKWVWRQSERSKSTIETSTAILPIDGFIGSTDSDVKKASIELASLLEKELGAKTEVYFLSEETPSVSLGKTGRVFDLPKPAKANSSDPISELLSRCVVDVIPKDDLEKRLRTGDRLRVKLGIDPTGPRIHIGRAVPIRKLRRFQELGHQVVLVIGDFTAQIGDASDKNSARQMLTHDEVRSNMETYIQQISMILDMSKVEIRWNSEWLGKLSFKDTIGLASCFTVAQMLERENFSERFITNKPIGLHEFLYPLMQGYDSVVLKADVELGGTDQLFNLMAGRELQRAFGQNPQAVMTNPLILGLDGRKMSTSWGNTICILDHPDEQYGKLMSISDDLIVPYMWACTDMPLSEITEVENELAGNSVNPIIAKKKLAWEVVALYHGKTAASQAEDNFTRRVQQKEIPVDIPTYQPALDSAVIDILINSGIVPSRSEARRLVEQGGVSLGEEKVLDPRALLGQLLTGRDLTDGIILKAGKRRFVKLVI
jgi:tyrosyl-tRNA synthetase